MTTGPTGRRRRTRSGRRIPRSEEHTSELQSLRHLVCRLLLEKKKTVNDYVLKFESCAFADNCGDGCVRHQHFVHRHADGPIRTFPYHLLYQAANWVRQSTERL